MIGVRVDDEVFLRLHEARHAEDMFRVTDENRDHLRPWMPWVDATVSADSTRSYLNDVQRKFVDGREYAFAILEHGDVVGAIGLEVADDASEGEIGYWLSAAAQGRGIMSRATLALLGFAFADLGLHRIVILCATNNVRSRAIPERLGFTLEGTLRERDQIPGQSPRDQVVYSLLRSEWEASSPAAPS